MRCLRWQLRLGGMASQDSDLWKIPVDGVPPARPFLASEGHTYVSIWLTFSIPLYIRFLKTSACCVSMFLSLFLSSLLLFTLYLCLRYCWQLPHFSFSFSLTSSLSLSPPPLCVFSLHLPIYLPTKQPTNPPTYIPTYLFTNLPTYLPTNPPKHLTAYLPTYMYLHVYLSDCMSKYMWISIFGL